MAGTDEIVVKITADGQQAVEGLKDTAHGVQQEAHKMEEGFGGVTESFEGMASAFKGALEIVGVTLAIEAIEKLNEKMDEIALHAVHLEHASALTGVSTKELQGLRAAAEEAGIGAEKMDSGLSMMTLRLQNARDGSQAMRDKLAAVGITLADLEDGSFNAASAMYKMVESGASTGQMMEVVGRRNLSLVSAFKELEGGQQGAIDKANELGAMSDEQIKTLGEYHKVVADLGIRWENFSAGIAAEVVPTILRLIDGFAELWKAGIKPVVDAVIGAIKYFFDMAGAMHGALSAGDILNGIMMVLGVTVKVVATAFDLAVTAVTFFGSLAFGVIQEVVGLVVKLGLAVVALFSGDMKTAAAEAKAAFSELGDSFSTTMDHWNTQANHLGATLTKIWSDKKEAQGETEIIVSVSKHGDNKVKPLAPKGGDPELEGMKVKLALAQKNSDEYITILEQMEARAKIVYASEPAKVAEYSIKVIEAKKALAAEILKIAEAQATAEEAISLKQLDAAGAIIKTELANGTINAATYTQLEQTLSDQRLAIQTEYYQKVQQLREADKVAVIKATADIAKATQDATIRSAKIQEESQARVAKLIQSVMAPIEKTFASTITGLIQRTTTWQKAMQQITGQMLQSFAQFGVGMVADWARRELMKTALSQTHGLLRTALVKLGLLEEVGAQAAATGTTVGIKAAEADVVITANAGEAASGAAASVASIPFVGWAMAAGVFAATMAMVLGAKSSASGGYDIPSGVNPVTQLHQEEMVLPAKHANVIRQMADGGGGGGGGGDVHLHVHTQSTQDFARFLKHNSHVIAPAIKQAIRNNAGTRV